MSPFIAFNSYPHVSSLSSCFPWLIAVVSVWLHHFYFYLSFFFLLLIDWLIDSVQLWFLSFLSAWFATISRHQHILINIVSIYSEAQEYTEQDFLCTSSLLLSPPREKGSLYRQHHQHNLQSSHAVVRICVCLSEHDCFSSISLFSTLYLCMITKHERDKLLIPLTIHEGVCRV